MQIGIQIVAQGQPLVGNGPYLVYSLQWYHKSLTFGFMWNTRSWELEFFWGRGTVRQMKARVNQEVHHRPMTELKDHLR